MESPIPWDHYLLLLKRAEPEGLLLRSVLVTLSHFRGGRIAPDHAVMSYFMDMGTDVHGTCRDHGERQRIDELQSDR